MYVNIVFNMECTEINPFTAVYKIKPTTQFKFPKMPMKFSKSNVFLMGQK